MSSSVLLLSARLANQALALVQQAIVLPAHFFDEERPAGSRAAPWKQGRPRRGDKRALGVLAEAERTVRNRAAVLAPLHHPFPVPPLHRPHRGGGARAGNPRGEIGDGGFPAAPPQRVE